MVSFTHYLKIFGMTVAATGLMISKVYASETGNEFSLSGTKSGTKSGIISETYVDIETNAELPTQPITEPSKKEETQPSMEDVTTVPTEEVTESSTEISTEAPTEKPTEAPSVKPTEAPTESPTVKPTIAPTKPVVKPTEPPTAKPTVAPTVAPTQAPTTKPTEVPTEVPTEIPTVRPTEAPTEKPTEVPTEAPTVKPTEAPTEKPTEVPAEPLKTKPTYDYEKFTKVEHKTLNGVFKYANLSMAMKEVEVSLIPDDVLRNSIDTNIVTFDKYINEVLALINIHRVNNGLHELKINDTLMQAAMHRAVENAYSEWNVVAYENGLAKRHIRPNWQPANSIIFEYDIVGHFGEVFGRYQTTPCDIVTGWKNSVSHNKLLLKGEYTSIGIGIAQDCNGYYYWIAVFNW